VESSVKRDADCIIYVCAFNCGWKEIGIERKYLKDYEKLIIITFDEVYLFNKIAIDRKCEQVIGNHKTYQYINNKLVLQLKTVSVF